MIQMIDDLPNRSRVVWALITTRPDLLDPDFVRSGRCSLFVPISSIRRVLTPRRSPPSWLGRLAGAGIRLDGGGASSACSAHGRLFGG